MKLLRDVKLLIEVLLVVGKSLCIPNDLQNVVEASMSQDTSLIKFSLRSDQQLSSGLVHHCRCLPEVCVPDNFQNVMGNSLFQGPFLVNFLDPISNYYITILDKLLYP